MLGSARRVVVGGGYGGAIAAKYVRRLDKSIEVVMVERNRQFVSCSFSNFYIAGRMNDMAKITIGYDKLAANHGIKMVYADVTQIDPAAKKVVTTEGTLSYDHQSTLLRNQLRAMKDGGTVIISMPPTPLSLPARPLRAFLPDRQPSQAAQAEVQADPARRQPRCRLQEAPVHQGLERLLQGHFRVRGRQEGHPGQGGCQVGQRGRH